LLKSQRIDPGEVLDLRYRGRGWPGKFAATCKGRTAPSVFEMSYRDSWAFLQAYRPYAVHLCPDGTGEDADIVCGDPWYRPVRDGESGSSLVLVRTELGRSIMRAAIDDGYILAEPSSARALIDSQVALLNKRRALWGRLLAFRLLGLPAPQLKGFGLFRSWLGLSLAAKLQSILGTLKRILVRRYRRPLRIGVPGSASRSGAHQGEHRPHVYTIG
jgi:coenzyme F420 hydrogenase subunit beta